MDKEKEVKIKKQQNQIPINTNLVNANVYLKKKNVMLPKIPYPETETETEPKTKIIECIDKLLEMDETIISKYIERMIYTSSLSDITKNELQLIYSDIHKKILPSDK